MLPLDNPYDRDNLSNPSLGELAQVGKRRIPDDFPQSQTYSVHCLR
jgi:hypothetical protein